MFMFDLTKTTESPKTFLELPKRIEFQFHQKIIPRYLLVFFIPRDDQ